MKTIKTSVTCKWLAGIILLGISSVTYAEYCKSQGGPCHRQNQCSSGCYCDGTTCQQRNDTKSAQPAQKTQ